MLQLKNDTGLQATINAFPNTEGIDSLYVGIKASFKLAAAPKFIEEQIPFVLADEFVGEPGESSIAQPSEAHLCKPSSDIILTGHACAPGCKQVRMLDAQLSVGNKSMVVRVIGDRMWDLGQMSSPLPFETMPLTYERAYGGVVIDPETGSVVSACEQNPVGTGHTRGMGRNDTNGIRLPNLEDPQNLISSLSSQPEPVCFASTAPSWQPRLGYAGTYDEQWQSNRAPYLPTDFDLRFFNMAHPRMIYPTYLQGGEPVRLANLHEDGPIAFPLPVLQPSASVLISGSAFPLTPNLETLSIDTENGTFSMIWRTEIACDKKLLKVEQVDIQCDGMEPYRV